MSRQPSSRDLMKLSAYLDGELSASASRKMKNRLARDPNLLAALDDLRETKSILQRIPKRPSPRNFTLSPQMVAKSPPMPRLVPALNYATALAMILFFFSILPPFGYGGAAMAPAQKMMLESADNMAIEAPVAEEAFAEEAMPMAEAPAVAESEEMTEELVPAAEAEVVENDAEGTLATEESLSRAGDDAEKAVIENQIVESTPFATLPSSATLIAPSNIEDTPESSTTTSFTLWQEILLTLIILFATVGFILRRAVMLKWQKRK